MGSLQDRDARRRVRQALTFSCVGVTSLPTIPFRDVKLHRRDGDLGDGRPGGVSSRFAFLQVSHQH